MNLAYYIFMFLWLGLPVILLIAFVILLINKIRFIRAIKRGVATVRRKVRTVVNVFFVIVTVFFAISFSCSLGLYILLSIAVANM